MSNYSSVYGNSAPVETPRRRKTRQLTFPVVTRVLARDPEQVVCGHGACSQCFNYRLLHQTICLECASGGRMTGEAL